MFLMRYSIFTTYYIYYISVIYFLANVQNFTSLQGCCLICGSIQKIYELYSTKNKQTPIGLLRFVRYRPSLRLSARLSQSEVFSV